jgi:hypothetical protein
MAFNALTTPKMRRKSSARWIDLRSQKGYRGHSSTATEPLLTDSDHPSSGRVLGRLSPLFEVVVLGHE